MTPEHKKFLTYNSESFTAWSLEVGPKTAAVMQYFLSLGREVEQGFKACASLIKLSERYGAKRLEKACERLLAFTQTPSIRTLTTILKNGQDKVQVTTQETIPNKQGITHGADYFRKGGNHNDQPIYGRVTSSN